MDKGDGEGREGWIGTLHVALMVWIGLVGRSARSR